MARSTAPNAPENIAPKAKAGKIQVFNLEAVRAAAKDGRPVFIVEGEIDAMSIEEAGGLCVGLGSISYVNRFFEGLDGLKLGVARPGFIIAMDQENKDNVRRAAAMLGEGLEKRGFVSVIAPKFPIINGNITKDANELLTGNPEKLVLWTETAAKMLEAAEEDYKETWLKEFRGGFRKFREELEEYRDTKPLDTGFEELNAALGGGVYNDLYVLGAVSSLGKTTFILQIADSIAGNIDTNGRPKEPRPVLFFALEMARNEMIAKSLSRMAATAAENNGFSIKAAPGKNSILRTSYRPDRAPLVLEAMVNYQKQLEENISFIEGVGDISALEIRGIVEKFTRVNKTPPVVVVDYLQIMAPGKEGLTDKQAVDRNILELKRISRDFKTPVFAISKMKRGAYMEPVSMKSFKESGAVEYTAGVLLGLQFEGIRDAKPGTFDESTAKTRTAPNDQQLNERRVECVVLKNRHGAAYRSTKFNYYPAHELFREAEPLPF